MTKSNVTENTASQNNKNDLENILTPAKRIARISAFIKHDRTNQFLKHTISYQTVGVLINRLPASLSADDTLYNAMIRAHHKNTWAENWDEALTELVKDYYFCINEVLQQTLENVKNQKTAEA